MSGLETSHVVVFQIGDNQSSIIGPFGSHDAAQAWADSVLEPYEVGYSLEPLLATVPAMWEVVLEEAADRKLRRGLGLVATS